jgi:predicted amidophosphoribosyltransferase
MRALKHFLLVYNRRTGETVVQQEFSAAEGRQAVRARFQLERELRGHDDIEIVVLTGTSLASLRKTHSRYFSGATDRALAVA